MRFLLLHILILSTLSVWPQVVVAQFVTIGDSATYFEVLYHHSYSQTETPYQVSNIGTFAGRYTGECRLLVGAIGRGDTLLRYNFSPGTYETLLEWNALPRHESISDADSSGQFARSFDDAIVYYSDCGVEVDSATYEDFADFCVFLRVKQTSSYWPVAYAKNILLIDFEITNLAFQQLQDVYLGIEYGGADRLSANRYGRVIRGYIESDEYQFDSTGECIIPIEFDLPWQCYSDGIPNTETGEFDSASRRGIAGIMILSPDNPALTRSWNWWITPDETMAPDWRGPDFGPRKPGNPHRPYRDWGVLGTPQTDIDRYYLMANGEIDYDQFTTALDHSQQGWLPPPAQAEQIVRGYPFTEAIHAVGPLTLGPGQYTHLVVAVLFADEFHRTPVPLSDKMSPYDPYSYYRDHLDFSELKRTALTAKWMYDNPGVDTDGDGYRGEYILCEWSDGIASAKHGGEPVTDAKRIAKLTTQDTVWYKGDGVPDFQGAMHPVAPQVSVKTSESRIELHWNGFETETTRDFFTKKIDFEGYRVWLGLTDRFEDLQMVSSYDLEDYNKLIFEIDTGGAGSDGVWTVIGDPYSPEELRAAYGGGNPEWSPEIHGIDNPLTRGDTLLYFARLDWNQSDLTDTAQVHKVFPDAPFPHTLNKDSAFTSDTWWVDSVTGDSVFYDDGELTADGKRFKYFEYRYILKNILPSVPYFVGVTAFDYGATNAGLPGIESNRLESLIQCYASDTVKQSDKLDVIVYPNPYRNDGSYRNAGYEGRGLNDFPEERVRLIHFTNLPPQCDIKIYTLDGDMVRQIIHDKSPGAADAMHDTWDVLSRNLQVPVSGIYYWVVETPDGRTQLGKLVLIM